MMPQNLPAYPSPAKLNLDLRIVGRYPNGYHALESIFTLIDLCDTLHIAPRNDGKITLHTPTQGVAPQDDLTVRAAQLLQSVSGSLNHGADIWLHKIIPMGGGLGGGSSNAATVLLVLNRLWGLNLPTPELIRLGVQLGADVPFFLFGQTAFAQGIGEKLQAFDVPEQYYIVVRPNAHVATASVFANTHLLKHSPSTPNPTWANRHPLRNDLQDAVMKQYEPVDTIFRLLMEYGEPRLTGSGSCLFLSYDHEAAAQALYPKLRERLPENILCWCVKGLPVHPLFTILSNT